jgi:hypothetical protein
LPEALAFPELRELSHAPRADIHLTWTGHGDAPLKLMLFVTAEPGPFLGVTSGQQGDQKQRDHRGPGDHAVARRRTTALVVPAL